jgi:hypothetical protein
MYPAWTVHRSRDLRTLLTVAGEGSAVAAGDEEESPREGPEAKEKRTELRRRARER